MIRRLLALLVLVAVVAWGAVMWQKRENDRRFEAERRALLRRINCPAGMAPDLPPPGTPRPDGAPAVALTEIGQLNQPMAVAARPGEDEALYFAEQGGSVVRLAGGRRSVVVDLSREVSTGREQGLLGIAFSPDGRYLYSNHTDRRGDTRVTEWALRDRGGPARREVLEVDQPHSWHNGGHVTFGPDGLLYVGLGDGGTISSTYGNGQDLGTLLGKILRIDPRPSGGRPYAVPPDNPFVGTDGARPEIWAYGLRNPWRFSFDAETRDLWIGDVGDLCFEEIDLAPAADGAGAGVNYGWRDVEGPWVIDEPAPAGHVPPVLGIRRNGQTTCAVVGGHVYRGSAVPALRGWYVFGDFCHGDLVAWRGPGTGEPVHLGVAVEALSSFGVDHQGELLALSQMGKAYRITPPAG